MSTDLVADKRARRAERWTRKANLPQRFTHGLGDLAIDDSVRFACEELVERVRTGADPLGRGLILWGPPGRGKSTIAVATLLEIFRTVDAAMLNHHWESAPKKPGYYITYPGLIRLEKKTFTKGDEADDARALLDALYADQPMLWENVKVLVLDDVGKEHSGSSGFTANVLHDLLRTRYDTASPTIITTNLRPREWEQYGEAMESFIHEAFALVQVGGEDRRR